MSTHVSVLSERERVRTIGYAYLGVLDGKGVAHISTGNGIPLLTACGAPVVYSRTAVLNRISNGWGVCAACAALESDTLTLNNSLN